MYYYSSRDSFYLSQYKAMQLDTWLPESYMGTLGNGVSCLSDALPAAKDGTQDIMNTLVPKVSTGAAYIFAGQLLLDEPAAGMNPNETAELMNTIHFVRDEFKMTILLIEHDMKLVSGICEELTVLNFGQELAQGETSAVLNDPKVITAYLGE